MATDDSSGRVSNGVLYCSLQQQLACFWTVVSWFVCVLPILTYTHILTCISTLTPIGHITNMHTLIHISASVSSHISTQAHIWAQTSTHVCTRDPGIISTIRWCVGCLCIWDMGRWLCWYDAG